MESAVAGLSSEHDVSLLLPACLSVLALGAAILIAVVTQRRMRGQRAAFERGLNDMADPFRLVFDSNPLPMWVFDRTTLRFLAVNEAAVTHYGYSKQQFLGMSIVDIRPESQRQEVIQVASADHNVPQGRVWRHRRADGSELDVAIYSRILTYAGRPASLIAVIDVTAQQRAESELRRARSFLDSIFDNVPVSVFVKDIRADRYVLVNRAGEDLLGIPRDQVIGRHPDDLLPGKAAMEARKADLADLQTGADFTVSDHLLETPGCGTRHVTTKRVMIGDGSGEAEYMLTVVQDHTELTAAQERIAYLARCDALTGLPNRAAFMADFHQRLDKARQERRRLALLSIDLLNFTFVNDTYGPAAGDEVLAQFARQMSTHVDHALVARAGGDEFMMLLDNVRPETAAEIAQRLDDLAQASGLAVDAGFQLGASIGIAMFPNDAQDADTLIANADAALHRAKVGHARRHCFFEQRVDQRLRDRRVLCRDMDQGLRLGEFVAHYQPQVDFDGTLRGFEALIRWQHPERGMISPGDFIPAAEESGQIIAIDNFMLRHVCMEAASWSEPLEIAVNLSPLQFEMVDLPGRVAEILADSGLAPERLELEITEGVLIGDSIRALSILRTLKGMGIRIAMDDFGTGYSSLAYLQSFPFDRLKIDRQFVADLETSPQSEAIVKAVIGLGHGLGLPVIAEGVETRRQLDMLREMGCDQVQGFLMGRPQPISFYRDQVSPASRRDQSGFAAA